MSFTELIEINPRKLGGVPVFRGTRIPVSRLFDYLETGSSVEDFIGEYEIDSELVRRFISSHQKTRPPMENDKSQDEQPKSDEQSSGDEQLDAYAQTHPDEHAQESPEEQTEEQAAEQMRREGHSAKRDE